MVCWKQTWTRYQQMWSLKRGFCKHQSQAQVLTVIPWRSGSNSDSATNRHYDPGHGHAHFADEETEAEKRSSLSEAIHQVRIIPLARRVPAPSSALSLHGLHLGPSASCFPGSHLTSSDLFPVKLDVCLPSALSLRFTAPSILTLVASTPEGSDSVWFCRLWGPSDTDGLSPSLSYGP